MERMSDQDLDKHASTPQCLDNQFVPGDIIGGFDPNNNKHQLKKHKETKKELIKSLLYSKQIFANRVAFFNNDGFIELYKNLNDKKGLVDLISCKSIIPILYNEDEFTWEEIKTKNRFSLNQNVENLFCGFLKEIQYGDGNYINILNYKDDMEQFMSMVVLQLKYSMNPNNLNFAMLSDGLKLPNDEMYIEGFKKYLVEIAKDYDEQLLMKNKYLSREELYKKWVVEENTHPVEMKFKKNSYAIETKKIIDLYYNYNLVNKLDRYLLTPKKLPSSIIIPSSLRRNNGQNKSKEYKDKVLSEELNSYIWDNTMHVPDWDALTIKDVYTIRNTPEWEQFINCQRELLDNPRSWNADTCRELNLLRRDLYLKIEKDFKWIPFMQEAIVPALRITFKIGSRSMVMDDHVTKTIDSVLDDFLPYLKTLSDFHNAINGSVQIEYLDIVPKTYNKIVNVIATVAANITLSPSDIDALGYKIKNEKPSPGSDENCVETTNWK